MTTLKVISDLDTFCSEMFLFCTQQAGPLCKIKQCKLNKNDLGERARPHFTREALTRSFSCTHCFFLLYSTALEGAASLQRSSQKLIEQTLMCSTKFFFDRTDEKMVPNFMQHGCIGSGNGACYSMLRPFCDLP